MLLVVAFGSSVLARAVLTWTPLAETMPPLESTIVKKVMDEARRLGWYVVKNHGNSYSIKGLPDLLCVKDGVAVWLEVKRPGEEATRVQLHRHRELRSFGCRVAVVTCVGEARDFLNGKDI